MEETLRQVFFQLFCILMPPSHDISTVDHNNKINWPNDDSWFGVVKERNGI
jgi:hypothetical protein